MTKIPSVTQVASYLKQVLNVKNVRISYFGPFSEYTESSKKSQEKKREDSIKTLGYGVPYLVVYSVGKKNGKKEESIISTMRIGHGFGHDFRSDRIDNLVLSYDTWNSLPNHVKVQDLGAFNRKDSSMISLGQSGEFFLLRKKISGTEYFKDLDRIHDTGKLEKNDVPKAEELAKFLAKIHSKKNKRPEDKELYIRKIRDTVGHGECIFGLADSYPQNTKNYLAEGELESIEKKCVAHRWKLRGLTSRLSQVHGDFHPWNILFKSNSTSFKLLDRSRGEWGEPADDVCGLSVNYLFYSLRKHGDFEGPFETLYNAFIDKYLELTGDKEIFEAMPLFYTFRALVIASPLWYPTLSDETRRKIFNFAERILDARSFDPSKVNDYFS